MTGTGGYPKDEGVESAGVTPTSDQPNLVTRHEDKFWHSFEQAKAKQAAGERTAPHHHYQGVGAIQPGGHTAFRGLPAAGRACTSTAMSCHLALFVGTATPCPACIGEASDG